MVVLGVLADTHIPDRARQLHPLILPIFRQAGVEAILHAGDISVPRVLAELAQVAPVHAVRGNRDIFFLRHLPATLRLDFPGVTVGMTHGHGSWYNYLVDRRYFTLHGYRHERLLPRLLKTFPGVHVIVFGHGHLPLNEWVEGRLLFNPGSPHVPGEKNFAPSVGLLHLSAEGEVQGEIVELPVQ